MATVFELLTSTPGELAGKVDVPLWLILLGSAGIAIGVVTWGWRVMETIGHKIYRYRIYRVSILSNMHDANGQRI